MTCGIYRFRNIRDGKAYVGSSVNCEARARQHRHDLRRGIANPKFQAAWNKYGDALFVFEIIETVVAVSDRVALRTILVTREQYHFDVSDFKKLYNVSPLARSCLGITLSAKRRAEISAKLAGRVLSESHKTAIASALSGVPHTESRRKAVGDSQRGKKRKPLTATTKAALSLAMKGKNKGRKHSAATRAAMSAAHTDVPLSAKHREAISAGRSI